MQGRLRRRREMENEEGEWEGNVIQNGKDQEDLVGLHSGLGLQSFPHRSSSYMIEPAHYVQITH
jgi:hypothetical protein